VALKICCSGEVEYPTPEKAADYTQRFAVLQENGASDFLAPSQVGFEADECASGR